MKTKTIPKSDTKFLGREEVTVTLKQEFATNNNIKLGVSAFLPIKI